MDRYRSKNWGGYGECYFKSGREAGGVTWSCVADIDEGVCDSKQRLVALRPLLSGEAVQAIQFFLKNECNHAWYQLKSSGLSEQNLNDVWCVLKKDSWSGEKCGKKWLRDWLSTGASWAQHFERAANSTDRHWCHVCHCKVHGERSLSGHSQCKEHQKNLKNWTWKYGAGPTSASICKAPNDGGGTAAVGATVTASLANGAAEARSVDAMIDNSNRACHGGNADILHSCKVSMASSAASAKRALLRYRDALCSSDRRAIIDLIGLHRANDVASVDTLRHAFSEEVYEWILQVDDPKWLYSDPTFSWLSGFYWHPESTSVPRQGTTHAPEHCHLCEVDMYNDDDRSRHESSHKHAERLQHWVERFGATELPQSCARCPALRSGEQVHEQSWDGTPPLDIRVEQLVTDKRKREEVATEFGDGIECNELEALRSVDSSTLPFGFSSFHVIPPAKRPCAFAYVAFVISFSSSLTRQLPRSKNSHFLASAQKASPGQSRVERVRIASRKERIGPREKKGAKLWSVDLELDRICKNATCLPEEPLRWRSLAIPLSVAGATRGVAVDFSVQVTLSGECQSWEIGWVKVKVPQVGAVAVVEVQVSELNQHGTDSAGAWKELQVVKTSNVNLFDFVGSNQIQARGGVEAIRGTQRAFQFATEDTMLSFLLHVPKSLEPAPLLVFLHGDLQRDTSQCPFPGLAGFCVKHGPALMCEETQKKNDAARAFVVVTPTCPSDYWWFRYPAEHDGGCYVFAMENWFRQVHVWLKDELGICRRGRPSAGGGMRLVGESMGGYAALELARAMHKEVAAVALGAPCFDAFRLDDLAGCLKKVPLWILIGRQDNMCSFEEAASLVLKLRDLGASCVRLTSTGIKGHNEAFKKLEKPWLYRWLLQPVPQS
eukprot:TRINITY_DN27711_c0_g2_i1.p1 TRINITY_DN27711_c0_g2~~TRINITY_DN27711_c0_g2_i1.p1  ORF type:complete len:890 (-),score=126.84 TRINITY_DN27711_c0_g2_i1:200-2869(-)